MPTKIPLEEEQRQLQQLEMEIQYHECVENINQQFSSSSSKPVPSTSEVKIPKKRGPKKKQMTPSRVARFKVRRIKANGRERERMKGLNEQLEVLRETIPCFSLAQKLSKIETLRVAKNYIEALTKMISTNEVLDNVRFADVLCQGLSPNTTNLVAATLSLNPSVLQHNTNLSSHDNYMLPSIHPRVSNPLEFINLKKRTISENDHNRDRSNSFEYGSSYAGDSSTDDISPMSLPEYSQSISTNVYSSEQPLMFTDNSFYYYHQPSYY